MEPRNWTHEESPEGKPSASAYRLGCRCSACSECNSAYAKAYRQSRVAEQENTDGTTLYHSHLGQPSTRTARRHSCIHPRCLSMAGLVLVNGIVFDRATGLVDTTFGTLAVAA